MRARVTASFVAAALLVALGAFAQPVRGGGRLFYVVVSAANPLQSLALTDSVALYTGRTRTFPDGREAVPYDQGDEQGARADFYRALTGMDLARINSYWARLRFSGQVQPPRVLIDDRQVVAAVRADPKAVGYLRSAPSDQGVKVVLTLPLGE